MHIVWAVYLLPANDTAVQPRVPLDPRPLQNGGPLDARAVLHHYSRPQHNVWSLKYNLNGSRAMTSLVLLTYSTILSYPGGRIHYDVADDAGPGGEGGGLAGGQAGQVETHPGQEVGRLPHIHPETSTVVFQNRIF